MMETQIEIQDIGMAYTDGGLNQADGIVLDLGGNQT